MSCRTVGIIIIGDEILKGQVEEKNCNFLCKQFYSLGLKVSKISVIKDDVEEIAQEVGSFSKKYTFVVTCGGVGPTHDDVTYQGIAKAFEKGLYIDENLKNFFEYYISSRTCDNNPLLKMVTVPEGSELIFVTSSEILEKIVGKRNFPVVKLENVFILPGVPLFVEEIFKHLNKDIFEDNATFFYQRTVYLNRLENCVTSYLNDVTQQYQNVSFGSYPVFSTECYSTRIEIESIEMEPCLLAESAFLMSIPPYWIVYLKSTCIPDVVKMQRFLRSGNVLVEKIVNSLKIIQECFDKYDLANIFVSFNGGKDCSVIMYLVWYVYQCRGLHRKGKIKALYSKRPMTFPQENEFVDESSKMYELDLLISEEPLKECLTQLLEKEPERTVSFLGVRNSDPKGTHLKPFQMTDKDWPQLLRVSPLLEWKYKDVWYFIRSLNIPYCTLYNEGYTSIGTQNNTYKNPALLYVETTGEMYYRPAYLLEECSKEREGRRQSSS